MANIRDQAAMSASTSIPTSIVARLALLCLFIAALLQPATALDAAYCADINTASSSGSKSSTSPQAEAEEQH